MSPRLNMQECSIVYKMPILIGGIGPRQWTICEEVACPGIGRSGENKISQYISISPKCFGDESRMYVQGVRRLGRGQAGDNTRRQAGINRGSGRRSHNNNVPSQQQQGQAG